MMLYWQEAGRWMLAFAASCYLLVQPLNAEEPADPAMTSKVVAVAATKSELPTLDGIESELKRLESEPNLTDEAKQNLVKLYTQARDHLRSAQEFHEKSLRLDEAVTSVPARIAALESQLGKEAAPCDLPTEDDLGKWEQLLTQQVAELSVAQKSATELEAEPKRRAAARVELPKQISSARQKLEEIEKLLDAGALPDETADQTRARRAWLLARKQARELQVQACEKELRCYEATDKLLTLERDHAARRTSCLQKRVQSLQSGVDGLRRRLAERQAREARMAAAGAHPAVKRLADENALLTELRAGTDGLANRIKHTSEQLKMVEAQLQTLRDNFRIVVEKEKRVGLTNAIGLLLRKQYEDLPPLEDLAATVERRQATIADVELELIDREEQRASMADFEAVVQEVLAEANSSQPPIDRDSIETAVREALAKQRDYLEHLIDDYRTYLGKLVDLNVAEDQLLTEAEKYQDHIAERILWVKSAAPLAWSDVQRASEASAWLTSPAQWSALGTSLLDDFRARPLIPLLAVPMFVLLWITQRWLRKRLISLGDLASKSYSHAFVYTLRALLVTLLISILWPAAICFLAWRIRAADATSILGKSVAQGLFVTALAYLIAELLRQVCRPGGLGEAHFEWPNSSRRMLRRSIRWVLLLGLPIVFLVATLEYQPIDARRGSLGRVAFVVGQLLAAGFAWRLLSPTHGVLREVIAQNRGGWLDRLSWLWYPSAVGLPLALAGAAVVGYHYTVLELAWRLQTTAWLGLGVLLVYATLLRWLMVARRKLAMDQARRRREQQAAGEGAPPATDEALAIDLTTIKEQTRRLLQGAALLVLVLGACGIWMDVLPALGILRRVALWERAQQVTELVEGTTTTLARVQMVPVTLADLALALLIAGATLVAGRNIPGLLEILVLQRLPLDAGGRYAVSTITKYVITCVGLVISFGIIGIGWSQVQWLAAAVTVGLGFGMQEIFANFVSGLIILFERPIRVGDTVTVGSTTGIVTKIRIRATTISDWDRKELIVPNKEFVTGQVINWSLSDPIVRMVIKVGIAYGSDTERARDLLLQIARETPGVLEDPKPKAVFTAFGDSTLDFQLRVFVPDMDHFPSVQHGLHTGIDQAFRRANIEIAFPQRDLHVRSLEGVMLTAESTKRSVA